MVPFAKQTSVFKKVFVETFKVKILYDLYKEPKEEI